MATSAVRAARSEADVGVVHAGPIEIEWRGRLEAVALEGGGDVFGIVRRIGQLRRIGIGAVTDHQRNAPVGQRRLMAEHKQTKG